MTTNRSKPKNTGGRRQGELSPEQTAMVEVAVAAHNACLEAWELHMSAYRSEKARHTARMAELADERRALTGATKAERERHKTTTNDVGALYAQHTQLVVARRAAVRRARRNGIQGITLAAALGVSKARITAIDLGNRKGQGVTYPAPSRRSEGPLRRHGR